MPHKMKNRSEWRGAVPAGVEVAAMCIELAHTRTKIHAATLRRRDPASGAWGPAESLEIRGLCAVLRLREPILDTRHETEVLLSIVFGGEAPRPVAIRVEADKVRLPEGTDLGSWYPADARPEAPVPPKVARRLWNAEVERMRVPASAQLPSAPDGRPRRVELAAAQTRSKGTDKAPKKAWSGNGADETAAASSDVGAEAVALAETAAESATAPDVALSDHAAVFAQRALAIERDHRIRRAFLQHDRETNPGLDPDRWSEEMDGLNRLLGSRIEVYAACGQAGLWPKHGPLQSRLLGKLEAVSRSFRAVFDELAAADTSVDLVDWAFEHFVTGAITTRHNDLEWQDRLLKHGTPDSAYYLRFPMLGVLCLENDVDADFWRAHLGTLVRTAHIFLESAAPLIDHPYPSDESQYAFYPDRCFPRSRRRELRAEYAALVGDPASDAAFDALRARLASLLGQALVCDTGSSVPKRPLSAAHVATLKAFGVDDA
jgi:hypothetical protein